MSLRAKAGLWAALVLLAIAAAAAISWFQNRDPALPDGYSADAQAATVIRVVDGDTITVDLDGDEQRVRLLNIDTPESVHPTEDDECGGAEASDRLSELLAPGDDVVLEFDRERYDQYDRLLAGVFSDETFVNEQLAREGWGEPVVFEPNDRFIEQIESAWSQAQHEKSGQFSPQLGCLTE